MPEEVLSLIQERDSSFPTLSATGNISLRLDDRSFNANVIALVSSDGSFRIDMLTPFYQPIYTILYHKGLLSVFSKRDKTIYRVATGEGADIYFGRDISLPLPAISSMLRGNPILLKEDLKRIDGHTLPAIVDVERSNILYRIGLRREGGSSLEIEVKEDKDTIFKLKTSLVFKDGIPLPQDIKASSQGFDISLHYDRVRMLDGMDDTEFALPMREGLEERYLTEFDLKGILPLFHSTP